MQLNSSVCVWVSVQLMHGSDMGGEDNDLVFIWIRTLGWSSLTSRLAKRKHTEERKNTKPWSGNHLFWDCVAWPSFALMRDTRGIKCRAIPDDLSEDLWWSSYQNSAPQETLDPSQEVTDRQDLLANPEALTIAALTLGGLVGLGAAALGFTEANTQRQEIRSSLAPLTAEPLGFCATEQMIIARLN
eukprot:TCALIF_09836-PA protein Name:"Protein of unknown function" AED:0.25 eAED:0.25 QI:0/0.33/0/0.75/1/1/4/0/186